MADLNNNIIYKNDKFEILTPDGFKPFKGLIVGENNNKIKFTFKDNSFLICTLKHKICISKNIYYFADDFNIGDLVLHKSKKYIEIIKKEYITNNDKVYEFLEIENNHLYYANDILSSQCLILDEFSFVENDKVFWEGVYPVISSSKNSKVVMVSTPNGCGNIFFETWSKATLKLDKDGWTPFRMDWWDVPGRDEDWKKKTIASLNGDMRAWAQEFGNSFHGSAYTLIDSEKILSYRKYISANEIKFTYKDLLPGYTADILKLKIFKEPIKGHAYIVGADIAEGIGADLSVFLILDITDLKNIEIVASYGNNLISPTAFAYVLGKSAALYNNAYIACENNNMGHTTLMTLINQYEYDNIISIGKEGKIGIFSHMSIKSEACLWTKDFINTDDVFNFVMNEGSLVYEMEFFERKFPSKFAIFQAAGTKHDDYMLAFIWAVFSLKLEILENYYNVKDYVKTKYGTVMPTRVENLESDYYQDVKDKNKLNLSKFDEVFNSENKDKKIEKNIEENVKYSEEDANEDNESFFAVIDDGSEEYY